MTTSPIQSITDEQIAELEGFLVEAENLGPITDCETVLALITRLRDAEMDAARYRWLRDRGDAFQWENILGFDLDDFVCQDSALDAAIDIAMKGDQQ